jgi:hypothetical protein
MRDLEGAQQALGEKFVRGKPAPFGPISPVIEPVAISSDAPSTARKAPKCR